MFLSIFEFWHQLPGRSVNKTQTTTKKTTTCRLIPFLFREKVQLTSFILIEQIQRTLETCVIIINNKVNNIRRPTTAKTHTHTAANKQTTRLSSRYLQKRIEREREREKRIMDISLPRMTGVVSSAFPSSSPSLLLRQEQDVRNREGGAEERNLKIPQIAVEPILNHYIEQRFGRALTEYNEDGETPLMEAVLSRDETSIFLILFHLANVKNGRRDDNNNNNSNNRRRNNYNNTYLSDDKEEADVEGGVVDDNNDVDDDDDKLLHVDPCYCPILNAKSLATGQTALHLACGIFGASNAIVELLLDNGCNLYETDLLGRTPLHISCSQYGSESLVRLLLESSSSSKNKRKKNKKQQDDKEGDDGYDFINTLDKTGSSPLHAATRKYNTNIVNLLLRQGAKLNSFDSYGCTPPLHEA